MATLALRVGVAGNDAVKTMQFDPGLQVFDACRIVRDKIPEANEGSRKYIIF
jgi:talin